MKSNVTGVVHRKQIAQLQSVDFVCVCVSCMRENVTLLLIVRSVLVLFLLRCFHHKSTTTSSGCWLELLFHGNWFFGVFSLVGSRCFAGSAAVHNRPPSLVQLQLGDHALCRWTNEENQMIKKWSRRMKQVLVDNNILTLEGCTPTKTMAPFDFSRCTRSMCSTYFLRKQRTTLPTCWLLWCPAITCTSSSLRTGIVLTLYFWRSSRDKRHDMILRRMCDGALKWALRTFRRDEVTLVFNLTIF